MSGTNFSTWGSRAGPVYPLVATLVREIYHLLTEEGYGTNRVAQYLNDRGIKAKKGKPNWRGTTIRSMVENPIYTGVLTFGDERSEPFESLRIIDDALFERCNEIVKGRSPKYYQQETIVPIRTDSRSLLTGLLFCADCGSRMCYSHNVIKRTLADGTPRVYERNLYRCYRKVSSKKACSGQSAYDMEPINAAVEKEVKKFLKRLASKPRETMKSEAFNLYTICAVLLMNLEHYSIRMLFKQLAIAILM